MCKLNWSRFCNYFILNNLMQIKCEICNNIMSDQIKGPTQSQGFKSIFWALGIIIMFSSVYALLKLASIDVKTRKNQGVKSTLYSCRTGLVAIYAFHFCDLRIYTGYSRKFKEGEANWIGGLGSNLRGNTFVL